MAVLDRTITVNAPVEKVFNFLIKPESWKEIYPGIIEIKEIELLPSGGHRYFCKYDMFAGIPGEAETENTNLVANEHLEYKSKCGFIGLKNIEYYDEVLDFNSENGKTKLTYHASNRVPLPIIHEIIEKLFMKMNERMIDKCLANLKTKMEN